MALGHQDHWKIKWKYREKKYISRYISLVAKRGFIQQDFSQNRKVNGRKENMLDIEYKKKEIIILLLFFSYFKKRWPCVILYILMNIDSMNDQNVYEFTNRNNTSNWRIIFQKNLSMSLMKGNRVLRSNNKLFPINISGF